MGVNRVFPPQIIHFKRVFHDFHHPFWGYPCGPLFWKHPYVYVYKYMEVNHVAWLVDFVDVDLLACVVFQDDFFTFLKFWGNPRHLVKMMGTFFPIESMQI